VGGVQDRYGCFEKLQFLVLSGNGKKIALLFSPYIKHYIETDRQTLQQHLQTPQISHSYHLPPPQKKKKLFVLISHSVAKGGV
jgi:hypothetical protein